MNSTISENRKLLWADKTKLYDDLVSIDNSIPNIFEEILFEIDSYDSTILEFTENENLKPKLTTYLLHDIIPLYELCQYNKQQNTSKLLAAELLSFFAWRTFDNCVDEHETPKTAHLKSLTSCMKFIGFIQNNYPNQTVDSIFSHYNVMADQSFYETGKPIELNNIWKRCSVVFYPIETLSEFDETSMNLFRSYINYTGLSHDMTDFIKDVSSQIISLPVYWFHQKNEYGIVNVATVKQIYSEARLAIKPIEEEFLSMEIENKFPLISYLLKQAKSIFHEK